MYQIVFGVRGQECLPTPVGNSPVELGKNGIKLDLPLTGRYMVEHTSLKSPPVAL